jgi:hypothetical protein
MIFFYFSSSHTHTQKHFDPKYTNITDSRLGDFLRDKVTGDLEEVPGIGPVNKQLLIDGELLTYV